MFVIEVKGKKYLWANNKDDDFLRFMPDHFECKPEDIKVHVVPDDVEGRKLNKFLSEGGALVDLDEEGKIKKKKKAKKESDPDEDHGEVVVKKLKRWPYDGKRFLGNEHE